MESELQGLNPVKKQFIMDTVSKELKEAGERMEGVSEAITEVYTGPVDNSGSKFLAPQGKDIICSSGKLLKKGRSIV